MKCARFLSFVNSLLLSGNVVAANLPEFSPYVDLTINTHWDSQTQDMAPMDLTTPALQHGIKSYRLAFINDSNQCLPAWGGQDAYTLEKQWGKSEVDKLLNNGIQVSISFGGASGRDISQRCTVDQLVKTYNEVIKTYHAQSLDFDIENGSANTDRIIQALNIVQKQHPSIKFSFTLPTMPEGLTAEGKEIVRSAKAANLNYKVNIMAMDYGQDYNGDMGDYAIAAATNLHQYLQTLYPEKIPQVLWQFIEVTPMIGINDVNIEHFTLDNADKLRQFAQNYQIGGLSMWSIARDKPCADKWASPICSGGNLQTHEYEFAEHLG